MKLLELWFADVKTKKHPKEGLFATGSATEIANWLKDSHDDLKSAMGALNFYVNRAGKNLSDTQKAKLAHVKSLLHAAGEKKKDKEKDALHLDRCKGRQGGKEGSSRRIQDAVGVLRTGCKG